MALRSSVSINLQTDQTQVDRQGLVLAVANVLLKDGGGILADRLLLRLRSFDKLETSALRLTVSVCRPGKRVLAYLAKSNVRGSSFEN